MTGRLAWRFGSAAAVVVAVLTAAPAPAAFAKAVITIDSPKADAALTSPSVTISGSVTSDAPLLSAPKGVTLIMKDQQQGPVSCTDTPCTFSWTVQLPLNGPYDFTVSATDATLGITSDPVTQSRHLTVAAPPKKPVVDTPKVTDGRTVELSWARNTEPDMLYYAVFRKDPAGSKFLQVGDKITQPAASQAKVTFTDTTTSFLGGDFSYQVVAVRTGASGTASTEVSSDPSAVLAASVPPPPTTTTAVPAPGSPGAAGPTTTVKPGQANGLDLSGFLSSRAGPASLPPITVPEPPDTGFQNTLPFGARPAGDDTEPGDEQAVPPTSTTHRVTSIVTGTAGRPLVPIAGGLVLLLLAMHLRLLNRRIKPVVDGDLPLGPPVTAGKASAPPPEPVVVVEPLVALDPDPAPAPAPETQFYDVLEEEAAWAPPPEPEPEAAWAPPADPEPEPLPELDPEPELREEMWAPELVDLEPAAALDDDFVYDLEPPAEPEPPDEPVPDDAMPDDAMPDDPMPDEIEVFDVVAPSRRRLVRSGSR